MKQMYYSTEVEGELVVFDGDYRIIPLGKIDRDAIIVPVESGNLDDVRDYQAPPDNQRMLAILTFVIPMAIAFLLSRVVFAVGAETVAGGLLAVLTFLVAFVGFVMFLRAVIRSM